MAVKNFTLAKAKTAVKFTIDKEEFEGIPANRLPADAMAQYFALINDAKLFEANDIFLKTVLVPESYTRFIEKTKSVESPITVQLLGEIIGWLISDVYMSGGEAGGGS